LRKVRSYVYIYTCGVLRESLQAGLNDPTGNFGEFDLNLTFDLNDIDLWQIRPVAGTPGVRLHVCAKFGEDRIIFVNLTFDLTLTFDLNDLDLCQIRPLSGTPGVRLHVYTKFEEFKESIHVELMWVLINQRLYRRYFTACAPYKPATW
jgi:hypothetical protein